MTEAPLNPNSSPITAKIKSVSASERKLLFLTAQKSRVHLANRFILMLLQLLLLRVLVQRLSAVVMVLVQKILLLQVYLLYMRNLQKMNLRISLQLVLTMMLQITHSKKKKHQTLLLRVQSSVNSGVSAVTEQLVLIKTLLKSSATILINMFRHTSSMTLRKQAVSQFLI